MSWSVKGEGLGFAKWEWFGFWREKEILGGFWGGIGMRVGNCDANMISINASTSRYTADPEFECDNASTGFQR